jgi:hypothetical protein
MGVSTFATRASTTSWGAMSREVEIVITHDKYDKRGDLFVEWPIGWAQSEYKAAVSIAVFRLKIWKEHSRELVGV